MKSLHVIIIMVGLLMLVPLSTVDAGQRSIAGIWGIVEFTDDFFPDFESFEISFWSKGRVEGLEDYYNYSLIYISGYRFKINNSLVAYVSYEDQTDFIKPLEKITMRYSPGDWNMTEIGYGYQQATLELVAANATSLDTPVPDDYIQFEMFLDREVSSSEMIDIFLIIMVPSIGLLCVIFLWRGLNNKVVENVTLINFIPLLLREFKFIVLEIIKTIFPEKKYKEDK